MCLCVQVSDLVAHTESLTEAVSPNSFRLTASTTNSRNNDRTSTNFMETSGEHDSVWVHKDPYSSRPQLSKLQKDVDTDVCINGSGISGVSIAYQLVKAGASVTIVEARGLLSGETGRTSGHLASDLEDGYKTLQFLPSSASIAHVLLPNLMISLQGSGLTNSHPCFP